MFLKSFSARGIRNLHPLELQWSPQCNVLLGKNGQGKTSALEAIYFLGSGKSFRTAKSQEIISFDSDSAEISGNVDSNRLDLSTEIKAELNKKSKTKFFVHNKESSLSAGYLGKLIVVAFVPGDTEIIRGAPGERRKFLDKHLVDVFPGHLPILLRYQKALKSKVALLTSGIAKPELLDPWDTILAEAGAQITASRVQFIKELEEHISAVLPLVAPKDGKVSLTLKNTLLEQEGNLPSADTYYKAIVSLREREIASERSLIGSHRDDLSIVLSGSQAREYSSQGQARTLTLLLKLSIIELIEARTGESPLVLLDDVDSELDENRAKFLFEMFANKNRQIFISSTNQSNLWPKDAVIFSVSDGQLSA